MRCSYRALLAAIAAGLQTIAFSQSNRGDSIEEIEGSGPDSYGAVAELESLFFSSDPSLFRAAHASTDLPHRALKALQRAVPFGNLVERGGRWNTGDLLSEDRLMAEFVVSWISATTALIVYRTGGWGISTNLLLIDSTVATYCVYQGYERGLAAELSVADAQQLLSSQPAESRHSCLPRDIALDARERVPAIVSQ